jgi:hypothetical protein
MGPFRRVAVLILVPLLALGAAALAMAGPVQASSAKETCAKPIDTAYGHTRSSLSTTSSEARHFLAEEAGTEINNAINDCLLQPGRVNASLERAKKDNAEAVKIYEEGGNYRQAMMLQHAVLRSLDEAGGAVR